MSISQSVLNTTVNIKHRSASTKNDIGEVSGGVLVTDGTNVPARITKNDKYGNISPDKVGFLQSSTHLMFTSVGVTINKGSFVYEGSDTYTVDYVDKKPGGKTDSHYQVYMTLNDAIQG